MEKSIEPKIAGNSEIDQEIKKSPAYKFAADNFDLLKKVGRIDLEIFSLVEKVKNKHPLLGDLDRKKTMDRLQYLEDKKLKTLDELIDQVVVSEIINVIRLGDKLEDAFDLIDEEKSQTDADDEDAEEDDELDEDDEVAGEIDKDGIYYELSIVNSLEKRLMQRGLFPKEQSKENKDDSEREHNSEGKRLEMVRDLLKKIPDKKFSKEVFDPQRELSNISSISKKEGEEKERRQRMEIKKDLLGKYKNELGIQAIGIGKINKFLEEEISTHENTNLENLNFQFKNMAGEYKLSRWQIARYENVFKEFGVAKKKIDEDWERYKNMPNVEVVKDLTGYACKGKVKIERYAFALVLIVSDPDDFARLYSGKYDDANLEKKDNKKAGDVSGFHRLGLVVIRKSDAGDPKDEKNTLIHELKHRINEIIAEGSFEGNFEHKYSEKREFAENVKNYFANELDFALYRAKDEILAYLKNNADVSLIEELLFDEKGIYNYLEDNRYAKKNCEEGRLLELGDKYGWRRIKKELSAIKPKYKNTIEDCLYIIEDLQSYGFPEERIIGIFQNEEMNQWSKTFKRLNDHPQFIKEINNNIKKQLPKIYGEIEAAEIKLEEYRKNNPWLKRKEDKLLAKIFSTLKYPISEKFSSEIEIEVELELLKMNKDELESILNKQNF